MPEDNDIEQQNRAKRGLAKARRYAANARNIKENPKKKAKEELVKQLAKRGLFKWATGGLASTGLGLPISVLGWSGQAIIGNLLNKKWIPKLGILGFVVWLLGSALVGALLFMLVAIIAPVAVAFGGTWHERANLTAIIGLKIINMIKSVF